MNQYENLILVHDVADSIDLGGISYLDFGPGFGSVCGTWHLFCEAISHKLAQKGVIYLLNYLFLNMFVKLTLGLVPWPLWWGKTCG